MTCSATPATAPRPWSVLVRGACVGRVNACLRCNPFDDQHIATITDGAGLPDGLCVPDRLPWIARVAEHARRDTRGRVPAAEIVALHGTLASTASHLPLNQRVARINPVAVLLVVLLGVSVFLPLSNRVRGLQERTWRRVNMPFAAPATKANGSRKFGRCPGEWLGMTV